MKKNLILVTLLVATMLVFVACGSQAQQKSTDNVELNISAAASLTDAFNELKELYIKDHPNVSINYNFAASGPLQKQIEEGAPVDVFVSANQDKMDELEQKNLILSDTRQDLLTNVVVLIANKDSKIKDFMDLTKSEVEKISIGEPASVPVGDYSKQVLMSLNMWEDVEPKLLLAKSVRQVLAYVDSGNVDAGLVYKTDAMIAEKAVIVAEAPENSHEPVIYPMAVVKESKNIDESKQFIYFLASKEASTVLGKYGFIPVN
jgi:molybdate transport system substrate-binding protein